MSKIVSALFKTKINNEEVELLPCPYMVGDVLITTNEIDPSKRYKGTTWQKIEEETFLMSASENYPVKSTGGENEHTLTIDEMPSHNHGLALSGGTSTKWGANVSKGNTQTDAFAVSKEGGGKSHNNMPKFFATYIWLRVA